MPSKAFIVIICLIFLMVGANANTVILPGSYQLSPSDILVLNQAAPDRTISYNVGILQGNEINFGIRYANLSAMNAPLGDTVTTGSIGVFHGDTELLHLDDIVSGSFSEATLPIGDLVHDGALQLRLATSPSSDPIAIYRPWLYITDDTPPDVTDDLAVTDSYRTGLRLEWTVVGDDGMNRNASFFEIRYSKWPVEGDTAEWWSYAEQASNVPNPGLPGSQISYTLGELDTVSTYYIILVTYDEVGNRSGFSNIASGITGQNGGPTQNYCLDFNGINSRAVIPNTPALNPTQALTIEAWIYCRDFTHWTQGFILGKSYPEYQYPFSQYFLAVTYAYKEYGSVTTADGVWHKLDNGPVNLQTNQWTHLSFTYDGSLLKLYVNGQFNQSTPVSGPLLVWPYNIYIGILEYLDGWGFNGLIDEIRIWNIARTQQEIQQTMNQRLSGNEPGLAGYWNFDEGEGQAFFDQTSHGSNGYLGSEPGADSDDPLWVACNSPIEGYAVGADPEPDLELPNTCILEQNYPNPFNSNTRIGFSLPSASQVRLEIYDMLGRQVTTLFDGAMEAGKHDIVWDGRSETAEPLSSGVYFYRLKSGNFDQTQKMLMIK